jgi:hypothetical protein
MKIKILEHDHQVFVIDWCNIMARGKYPMLKYIYAVPNGARVARSTANKLKAEGMKAGVPDLCLPYPKYSKKDKEVYHGLYIEMKSRDTRGALSQDQKDWLEYLDSVGYKTAIAWTGDEARQVIKEYLDE